MIIPLRTDAPIYHVPFATLTLVALNILAFALTGGGYGTAHEPWILHFGAELHPGQWVSSAFVHFGFGHLIGNMLFLWAFGMIVEGKLGFWRFALLYLTLAFVQGACTQVLMLNYTGPLTGMGGASGVIFGLLAICMLWAPRNNINVLVIVVIWPLFLKPSLMTIAMLYIGLDLLSLALNGFQMSSEFAHVFGAILGLALGWLLLRTNLVDCEDWDLFSLWRRKPGARLHRSAAGSDVIAGTYRRFEQHLERWELPDAFAEFTSLHRLAPHFRFGETHLRRLANRLYKAQDWDRVPPVMRTYIEQYPDQADRMRLKLAGVLVREMDRPREALTVLKPLRGQTLPDTLRGYLENIRAVARQRAGRSLELI